MRQLFFALFVTAALSSGFMVSETRAQTSLLYVAAASVVLFGGDDMQPGSNGALVIFTLPRVSERVQDPLGIRLAAVPTNIFEFNYVPPRFVKELEPAQFPTLGEIFSRLVANPDRYEILQIVRVFDEISQDEAALWFAYIEKEKVIPLDELLARE